MFDLSGRAALVTGAGQGIGVGIARSLVAAGARVAVNDLVPERADATAAAIDGVEASAGFDVGDHDAVAEGIRAVEAEVGPLDILVNNAGIPPTMAAEPFVELEPDRWRPYVDVNLYGVVNCCSVVVPGMCERGHGRVVVISSAAGVVGLPIGVSMYGAGKAGALGFTRHLAVEVGPSGVTANALALGLMEREGARETELARAAVREVPVRRLGRPDDVGPAVVWLASDEAAWVTGQTIHLNGGAVTT